MISFSSCFFNRTRASAFVDREVFRAGEMDGYVRDNDWCKGDDLELNVDEEGLFSYDFEDNLL